MKALRYLLMTMAVLSVLSLSAQTPQYGKTYTPMSEKAIFCSTQAQMPEAQMGSVGSDFMKTGSTLPMAATDGTTFGETGNADHKVIVEKVCRRESFPLL